MGNCLPCSNAVPQRPPAARSPCATSNLGSKKSARPKTKKPRPCGGALHGSRQVAKPASSSLSEEGLVGGGSARSGRGSSVSGSLGCVGSRSRSGVGGGGSGFGSSRGRCGSRSGCFHGSWCRCRSGFFLLATSGECSSCDQGGQNERVLHFDFPSWTDRVLREATASGFVIAPDPLAHALGLHHFGAASNYIGI